MNLFKSGAKTGYRVTVASDWAPIWSYEALMQREPLAVYGDLLPILRESDLNIVNVECVLGEKGQPIPKAGPCLRGDEAASVAALKGVPFHVATLANNHSMDYGPESLEHTLAVLKGAGVRTVGAGMNGEEAARPLIIENNELRLAIVNCGEGEACASLAGGPGAYVYDLERQEEQIRTLKGEVDAVIVIFHGGREHAPMPPPYVVRGLRRLAQAGAAAVVAHHPHVPQGLEVHGGVPIAYSQGNFVFRREIPSHYRNTGYLMHLDFAGRKISDVSITPYRMKPQGVFALCGEEKQEFLAELEAISRHLADPQAISDLWDAFVDEYGDGEKTVLSQLERALEEYKTSPASAIARFHHYFFAPAHQQYFENAFERLKRRTFDTSPQWARDLVKRWAKRELE